MNETQAAQPLRALVVEDDPVTRALVLRALSTQALDVRAAGLCAEAIAAFQREPIDVVVMDANLPDGDGYETTRVIKELAGEQLTRFCGEQAPHDDVSLLEFACDRSLCDGPARWPVQRWSHP